MPLIDLQDVPLRELFEGFEGKFIHTERMTFIHWIIRAGALLPEHAHPHEQVSNILEGRFEFTIDGQTKTLGPGTVAVIPPNAVHSGQALTRCRIIDAFCPVREDYR